MRNSCSSRSSKANHENPPCVCQCHHPSGHVLSRSQWVPVDVQDLLELLGSSFVNAASLVREYAVAALRERATDGQLLSYLLPLVQAIQYERDSAASPEDCPLAALLIQRAIANAEVANFFHWSASDRTAHRDMLRIYISTRVVGPSDPCPAAGICTWKGTIHGMGSILAVYMMFFWKGCSSLASQFIRCSAARKRL